MIASPGVFPTALLVWIDDLLTQGFVVLEPPAEDAPRRRCRIEVSRSGN